MASTTVEITGRIFAPDDAPAANAFVRFTLTGFDTDAVEDTVIVNDPVEIALDSAGEFTGDLFTPNAGTRTRFYQVDVVIRKETSDWTASLGKIAVPETGTTFDLSDLLPITPPSGQTCEEYVAQIMAIALGAKALVDDLTVEQVYTSTVSGTADAIALTTGESLLAYTPGHIYSFEATADNTGAVTVAVDALSAVSLLSEDGQALTAGMVVSGTRYMVLCTSPTELILLRVNKAEFDRLNTMEAATDLSTAGLASFKVLTPSVRSDDGEFINKNTGAVTANDSFEWFEYPATAGKQYKVTIRLNGGTTGVTWLDDTVANSGSVISSALSGTSTATDPDGVTYTDELITAPAGATYLVMSQRLEYPETVVLKEADTGAVLAAEVRTLEQARASQWFNRKVAWFGPSIPNGYDEFPGSSYAEVVAAQIGAKLSKKCVNGGVLRGGWQNDIDVPGGDPYGYFGKAYTQVWNAFGADLTEKQWIIDNWATLKDELTGSPPATLTTTQEETILSRSYENALVADNLGEARADLFVFDYGYNDATFVGGDPYVDATAAAELAVNGAGTENRYTYLGALNHMTRLIWEDNPNATIVILGHFEDHERSAVSQAQLAAAGFLCVPVLRLWEGLGWSEQTMSYKGAWDDTVSNSQVFVPDAGNTDTGSKLRRILPDGVHPGRAANLDPVNQITSHIVPFLNGLNTFTPAS